MTPLKESPARSQIEQRKIAMGIMQYLPTDRTRKHRENIEMSEDLLGLMKTPPESEERAQYVADHREALDMLKWELIMLLDPRLDQTVEDTCTGRYAQNIEAENPDSQVDQTVEDTQWQVGVGSASHQMSAGLRKFLHDYPDFEIDLDILARTFETGLMKWNRTEDEASVQFSSYVINGYTNNAYWKFAEEKYNESATILRICWQVNTLASDREITPQEAIDVLRNDPNADRHDSKTWNRVQQWLSRRNRDPLSLDERPTSESDDEGSTWGELTADTVHNYAINPEDQYVETRALYEATAAELERIAIEIENSRNVAERKWRKYGHTARILKRLKYEDGEADGKPYSKPIDTWEQGKKNFIRRVKKAERICGEKLTMRQKDGIFMEALREYPAGNPEIYDALQYGETTLMREILDPGFVRYLLRELPDSLNTLDGIYRNNFQPDREVSNRCLAQYASKAEGKNVSEQLVSTALSRYNVRFSGYKERKKGKEEE